MVRKLSIYMLISFLCITGYGYASTEISTLIKNFQTLPFAQETIPACPKQKAIKHKQIPIQHLVQQLKKYTSATIKDYSWTATEDYVYTAPIRNEKIGKIFLHLEKHEDSHRPLSQVVGPDEALSIKEAYFNGLLNTDRCEDDEKIKQTYDKIYEQGEFYKKYNNYTTSAALNPARYFAETLWKYQNNQLINLDPNNEVTIQELKKRCSDSYKHTAETWISIKNEMMKEYEKELLKRKKEMEEKAIRQKYNNPNNFTWHAQSIEAQLITALASQLKNLHALDIQAYQWTPDHKEQIKYSLTGAEKKDWETIFSLLQAHMYVHQPLSHFANSEHATSIKEAFIHDLMHTQKVVNIQTKVQTKILEYDKYYGQGAFQATYGDYKTSSQLNPVHHFINTLWEYKGKQLVSRDPENMKSIRDLMDIHTTAITTTTDEWKSIKNKIKEQALIVHKANLQEIKMQNSPSKHNK